MLCGVVEARQKSQRSQNLWVHPSYCVQTSELRDLLVTSDPQIRPAVHLNIHRSNTLLLHAKILVLLSFINFITACRKPTSVARVPGRQNETVQPAGHIRCLFPKDSFRLLAISSYLIWTGQLTLQ